MKALPQVLLTIFMLLVFGYFAINIGNQLHIQDMQNTYKICMAAHTQTNGASESACGDAQDRTNTEFMCNNLNSHCWLEVK